MSANALRVILASAAGLLIAGAAYEAITERRDRRRFLAPGRLVDVGGYRLHLNISGENNISGESRGAHTVIPDAGMVSWQSARELHTALQAAGIPGPSVLAGHSHGGLTARALAALYRDDVAGMVLVDGSHADQWERFGFSSTPRALATASAAALAWDARSRPLVRGAPGLGDLPLVVLSVTEQPKMGDKLTELQAELPALSSNSEHVIVQDAYHEGLLTQREFVRIVTEKILQVVQVASSPSRPRIT